MPTNIFVIFCINVRTYWTTLLYLVYNQHVMTQPQIYSLTNIWTLGYLRDEGIEAADTLVSLKNVLYIRTCLRTSIGSPYLIHPVYFCIQNLTYVLLEFGLATTYCYRNILLLLPLLIITVTGSNMCLFTFPTKPF